MPHEILGFTRVEDVTACLCLRTSLIWSSYYVSGLEVSLGSPRVATTHSRADGLGSSSQAAAQISAWKSDRIRDQIVSRDASWRWRDSLASQGLDHERSALDCRKLATRCDGSARVRFARRALGGFLATMEGGRGERRHVLGHRRTPRTCCLTHRASVIGARRVLVGRRLGQVRAQKLQQSWKRQEKLQEASQLFAQALI